MATKHTPGPWIAKTIPDCDTNCLIVAVGTPPITTRKWPNGKKESLDNFDIVICWDLRGRGRFNKEIRENAEANARLIAAAPDYDSTLRHLADFIVDPPNNYGMKKQCDWLYSQLSSMVTEARAAIAKTEAPTGDKPEGA